MGDRIGYRNRVYITFTIKITKIDTNDLKGDRRITDSFRDIEIIKETEIINIKASYLAGLVACTQDVIVDGYSVLVIHAEVVGMGGYGKQQDCRRKEDFSKKGFHN
ncbi:MAG: hypothetical protein IKN83_08065 [Bacteroidaceae bacterium]|nr:hypothetical protein [Bacteroidaceae bacterium]